MSLREHPEELLPFYVNGTLGGEEERQVTEHVHACLVCRRQVEELRELRRLVQEEAVPVSDDLPGTAGLERLLNAVDSEQVADRSSVSSNVRPSAPRRSLRPWLALAAMVVVAVGISRLVAPVSDPPPVVERAGEEETAIVSLIASGEGVTRDDCTLRWQTTEAWREARFSFYLMTADLSPIDEAHDLEEKVYQVPRVALKDLPAKSRLVWRVEATRQDGTRATSETFDIVIE